MKARMHIADFAEPMVGKPDVKVLCGLAVAKAVPIAHADLDRAHNAVTLFFGPRTCTKCLNVAKAGNSLRYRYGLVSAQEAIVEDVIP